MVLKSDKEKVKTLLSETIRLLCKNGLHFKSEFCVEALVGITLDQNEEFFLSIKETVKSDLVSSTKESLPSPRKSKSERHERRSKDVHIHIKGEPSSSPCQRKRPAETLTSEGDTRSDSGELGNLSLGDMHEGDHQFWSAVTDGGGGGETGGGGAGTPYKKRHMENPEESSSNSNTQIVIKGEPDSDSDIEEVASTSQDHHQVSMGGGMTQGHSQGSYQFGSPAASSATSFNVPHTAISQQVWDQLPPFSTLPGTSGIPSAPSTVTSPDGQQQLTTTESSSQASDLRTDSTQTVFVSPPITSVSTAATFTTLTPAVWIQGLTSSGPVVYTSNTKGARGHKVKHRCPTCDTPCVNKGSLLRHMKIHLESPEFKCTECGQSYYEKWRLARHIRAKHQQHQQESYSGVVPQVMPGDGAMNRGVSISTGNASMLSVLHQVHQR